jgi:hypothetical protein
LPALLKLRLRLMEPQGAAAAYLTCP